MTGYGEANLGHLHCEVRSLNHRFFDITLNIPSSFSRYEFKIRTLLKERIRRGAVSLKIFVENSKIEPDIERAKAYYDFLTNLKQSIGLKGEIPIDLFLDFKRAETPSWGVAKRLINAGIDSLLESKAEEGSKLLLDIDEKLGKIEDLLKTVEQRRPEQTKRREQLIKKLAPFVKERLNEHKIDEEFAFLLMKEDFEEEQTRFNAHFKKFQKVLRRRKSSGKYLGFLLQEMQRELNTISAKAKDVGISSVIVELKKEVEDLREQVENIE